MTSVTDRQAALEASAQRLATSVGQLSPDQLTGRSYASEWSIAQVLSHVGSGAVIMRAGIDAAAHTPSGADGPGLDELRKLFPGV
ncbi:MAG: maleylpyruvate isomerase N-terminal domain-containing protein [Ilumatobacteraceae bacterium]